MDSMVLIMFGSVIATITGLNFMELRKIRKHLERKSATQEATPQEVRRAPVVSGPVRT
ncbi:MAG TPA: hypothetical protein VEH30_11170 [Terriglobales bacterium]|nr:hypothetical protein [Terriglobales bacterium]